MPTIPPGANPRQFFKGKFRERGRKKYIYTVVDIAKAAGVTVDAVKWGQWKKSIYINDLASVAEWIVKRRSASASTTTKVPVLLVP